MKESWDFTQAAHILESEIELLRKIATVQNNVRQAVISREWTDFDEKILEINQLSTEFALLEEERAEIFSCLEDSTNYKDEERPFNALIENLPGNEKRELSSLYRELKMETHKMRALNETFLAYINEAKNLATAYIEAVCPDRGGKLYTRRGKTVTPDLRSIVINNRF